MKTDKPVLEQILDELKELNAHRVTADMIAYGVVIGIFLFMVISVAAGAAFWALVFMNGRS